MLRDFGDDPYHLDAASVDYVLEERPLVACNYFNEEVFLSAALKQSVNSTITWADTGLQEKCIVGLSATS